MAHGLGGKDCLMRCCRLTARSALAIRPSHGSGNECRCGGTPEATTILSMFTRTHRIGRHAYTEALESYRDPETGKPRHRCIARWRAERSLAEELGRTRYAVDCANESVAYWQGIIDRTVRPRSWKQIRRAP